MAEFDALMATVRAQNEALTARVAAVKDGRSVTVEDCLPAVTEALSQAVGNLGDELRTMTSVLVTEAVDKIVLPKGDPGKDADPEVLRASVKEAVDSALAGVPDFVLRSVSDAVAQLPAPKDGKDADPEVLKVLVEREVEQALAGWPKPPDAAEVKGLVEAAVSALPIPEVPADRIEVAVREAVAALPPAPPGKDADMEALKAFIVEQVAALPPAQPGKDADMVALSVFLAEQVAALPPAQPGKDADMEALKAFIVEQVGEQVAALPSPQPGKDVDMAEVESLVAKYVSEIPPAAPGKDADMDELRAFIEEQVAALPKPQDGAPGLMPEAREWVDGVSYRGAVVTHCGATWQALRDTGRAPPHSDWICLAAAGLAGRSFTIRGTWSSEETYAALDVVALNGASFVARSDNPGPCPGEGWQLMSMQGKQGKPGVSLRVPGPPGPPVTKMEIDGEGLIVLTNADGSRVECDLYPVLSKL